MNRARFVARYGGYRLFGFGEARKRKDAIYLTNALLEAAYEIAAGKRPPRGLAETLVSNSWSSGAATFGGRKIGEFGMWVHVIEALRFGYLAEGLSREEQVMAADAFMSAIGSSLKDSRVSPHDREYIALSGQLTLDDPRFEAARMEAIGKQLDRRK